MKPSNLIPLCEGILIKWKHTDYKEKWAENRALRNASVDRSGAVENFYFWKKVQLLSITQVGCELMHSCASNTNGLEASESMLWQTAPNVRLRN